MPAVEEVYRLRLVLGFLEEARLFQDLLHLPPQLRQSMPNGFPNQWHVHTKVKVNEVVPHPGHLLPWHFGISFPDNLG
jgi:hypothetical protein